MAPTPLKPPNPATSPLVRGARYIMLPLGFFYGAYKLKKYSAMEVKIQKEEDEIRARRDARLAREKAAANKVEMNKLAEDVGVPNRI